MTAVTKLTNGDAERTATASPQSSAGGSRNLALPILVALLFLRTAAIFVGDGLAYAATGSWRQALLYSNVGVVVLADVGSVLVLVLLCRRDGRRLRDLFGPVRPRRDVPIGLGLGVVFVVALLIATFLANLAVYQGAPPTERGSTVPLWLGIWSVSVLPVTVAVAEELFYRGSLLPRFAERIGWWPAALVVSAAFGLQHAAFSATSWQAVAARVITTFVLGLLLAVLARRLGRLLPLIIGHWLVDLLGLGLPLLITATGAQR